MEILDTVPVNAPLDASKTTEPLCLTSPVTSPVILPTNAVDVIDENPVPTPQVNCAVPSEIIGN